MKFCIGEFVLKHVDCIDLELDVNVSTPYMNTYLILDSVSLNTTSVEKSFSENVYNIRNTICIKYILLKIMLFTM